MRSPSPDLFRARRAFSKGNTGRAAGKLERDDFEAAALRIAAFAVR
jgi:hypothetical protein